MATKIFGLVGYPLGHSFSKKYFNEKFADENIDAEYKRDGCMYLLSLFQNKGENEYMEALPDNELPVGKYHLSTYKYALNIYIKFKSERQKG